MFFIQVQAKDGTVATINLENVVYITDHRIQTLSVLDGTAEFIEITPRVHEEIVSKLFGDRRPLRVVGGMDTINFGA